MSHSFRNVLVHCVFSTHERRNNIPDNQRARKVVIPR